MKNYFLRTVLQLCAFVTVMCFLLPDIAQTVQPVSTDALKNASKSGEEWLTTGRDYSETRYSPLKQIDHTNVSRLGLAWYYDTKSDAGAVEATPTPISSSRTTSPPATRPCRVIQRC